MNVPLDIRWKQRFQNFTKALDRLGYAAEIATRVIESYYAEFEQLRARLESEL